MSNLIKSQKDFYMAKLQKFGDDPRSLSWNSPLSQALRHKEIGRLFQYEHDKKFSVHEVGCGLAHFNTYLKSQQIDCEYSGSDICLDFLVQSKNKFPDCIFTEQDISRNVHELDHNIKGKDYYVLCGTFNPIGDVDKTTWDEFIFHSIENIFHLAKKGIAFNFLTIYSDENLKLNNLYYSDPKMIYDWCYKNLSRFITLSSNQPFYEFTVLVYKQEYIRELHPEGEFEKYFNKAAY